MPITKLTPTYTFTEDRLAELRAVVPEAFADGKINWDILREALGEHLEDPDAEHFGLFWPGKREARRLASLPSKGTLVPVPGEGVDEDTTRNIFIEGENLEVLKLLQKAYAGRVKLIYIDPPYNSGNDFIYPDDYSEPLDVYLGRTGQVDDVGRFLTTNTRASGRFHSNWLSMLYPRLRLAHHLLAADGIMFVSIDDKEMHDLRHLLNEVFGEENFLACIVWQKMYSGKADASHYGVFHEYILCYAKGADEVEVNLLPRTEEMDARYKNPDNDPRGPWLSNDLTAAGERSRGHYDIISPTGRTFDAPQGKHWLYAEETMQQLIEDSRVWFGKTGSSFPRLKRFLSEVQQGRRVSTLWLHEEVGHTDEATKELQGVFGVKQKIFDTPKPTRLMSRLLHLATSKDRDDIVLDFFAGSCSMAHALLEFNRQDRGNRRFVMVQLPEPVQDGSAAHTAGYATIADIGKDRIRRVLERLKSDDSGKLNLDPDEDIGFKCYCLDRSHFKAWADYEGHDLVRIQTLFDQFESPLVDSWQPQDLLTEILLIEGFPLDSAVTHQPAFSHNIVHLVTSDFHEHRLFVCLDPAVHDGTVRQLDLTIDDVFVCLDAALTDQSKMRLSDACNLKVI